MKTLLLLVFLVSTFILAAQPKKAIHAIDSLSELIDANKLNSKIIKMKSRNNEVVERRIFEIDTLTNRFIKVSTQIENSTNVITYYFSDNNLIKVRRVEIKNVEKPTDFYFRNNHLIYSSSKQETAKEFSDITNTASELIDFVAFVRSKN
jgi:hypothetical protein